MTRHQKNATASRPSRLVAMWREGNQVCVEGMPEQLLERFQKHTLVTTANGQHGYEIQRQPQPLYEVWEGFRPELPILKFWVGLEPAVRLLLTRAGFAIRVLKYGEYGPVNVFPKPEVGVLKKIGGADLPFLDYLRTRVRGRVIIDPHRVSPASLVLQAALAFPDAKITVAVTRIEDGYNLRNTLRKRLHDVQFFCGKHHPERSPRAAVTTYRFLHHAPVNLFERDFVFALDAREAVCAEGLEQLALAQKARLFGFMRQEERISPHERDLVAMVFGFEELTLPRHGHRERGVQVARFPVPDGPTLPTEADEYTVQSEAVWGNRPRNEAVAALARSVSDRDTKRLRETLPDVAAAISTLTAPRVVILVEHLRHGLALAERLPGWPMLADRARVNTRGLTEAQVALLNASHPGWDYQPPCAIATATGMKALDLREIDVVVRADAGSDLPVLSDQKLIEPDNIASRELILLDPDDRHPLLRKRSRQRRRACEERGWFAPGADPVQRRVELFLAARGM